MLCAILTLKFKTFPISLPSNDDLCTYTSSPYSICLTASGEDIMVQYNIKSTTCVVGFFFVENQFMVRSS